MNYKNKILKKGLVQVYTGDGKGKTTAALGLAFRAAGHGLNVYMLQCLKPQRLISGEMKAQERLEGGIVIERLEAPWWSLKSFTCDSDKKRMKQLLEKKITDVKKKMLSIKYDVIILDEMNNCLHHNLVELETILLLIKEKPPAIEIILTGRDAPEKIVQLADLVTEMKCLKHPYTEKVAARKGIEY